MKRHRVAFDERYGLGLNAARFGATFRALSFCRLPRAEALGYFVKPFQGQSPTDSGHFVPGYFHSVPPGQKIWRLIAAAR
jgi:hypothetical protein